MMNFSKNKKKAVITMLSLALGGILFMTAATFMTSFDKDNYARQVYGKKQSSISNILMLPLN